MLHKGYSNQHLEIPFCPHRVMLASELRRPCSNHRQGPLKAKVYYFQDLEIAQYTQGHTLGDLRRENGREGAGGLLLLESRVGAQGLAVSLLINLKHESEFQAQEDTEARNSSGHLLTLVKIFQTQNLSEAHYPALRPCGWQCVCGKSQCSPLRRDASMKWMFWQSLGPALAL